MLKRKPANKIYQMLLYYEGEYKPKQNNIDSIRDNCCKKKVLLFI